MKKQLTSVVTVLALTLMSACSDAGASIAGNYEVDKAALKEAAMAEMPAEAKANADAAKVMDEMFAGVVMDLELKADKTAAMTVKMDMMGMKIDEKKSGTWKVDDDKVSVTIEDGDKEDTQVFTVTKDGKLSGQMDMGGKKQTVTFMRKKA